MAQLPGRCAINNPGHALNRYRAFRHIGRQNHTPPTSTSKGSVLFVQWQIPVQGQYVHAKFSRHLFQRPFRGPDFAHARQKRQ